MNAFNITVYTTDKGVLAKTFGITDGKVVQQRPGLIATGGYQTCPTTLEGLASYFKTVPQSKALGLGTADLEKGKIVTGRRYKELGSPVDPIPRSKEHFKFRPEPTVMLLDVDGVDVSIDNVLNIISMISPEFAKAEKLITSSSSSGLYLGGKLVKNSTSKHIYIVVKDGTDIPRFMGVLFKWLWLVGHGRIVISEAGTMLERSLIDDTVAAPERVVYEAPPILNDGITQIRDDPKYIPGTMINTSLLPDLTSELEAAYETLVKKAKSSHQAEAEKVAIEHDKRQAELVAKATGVPIEDATRTVQSRREGQVSSDDILYLNKNTPIRVSDITPEHHQQTCCDPLEPSYHNWHSTVAKIFVNDDGSVVINSMAHGGAKYHVRDIDLSKIFGGGDAPLPPPTTGKEKTWQIELRERMDALDETHASVLIGGKFRIIKEQISSTFSDGRIELSFMTKTDFNNFYESDVIHSFDSSGNMKAISVSKNWCKDPKHRRYDEVIFAPGKDVPATAYNLFKGFPIKATQGNWSCLKDLMFNIICGGNVEYFNYLMGLCAHCIQDPGGDLPGVAVVMMGKKGIGKGIFMQCFGALFGQHYTHISSTEELIGKFNFHLASTLVCFLDEAVWGGDKNSEGVLKARITEPTIMVQPKGIDMVTMRNYMRSFLATNNSWAVPATDDERRWFVLNVSPARKGDKEYFDTLMRQMKNGGYEAFMYDLLHYDYSGINLRNAPRTVGLQSQIEMSWQDVHKFWAHVLERGFLLSEKMDGTPRDGSIFGWQPTAFKDLIYFEFENVFCKGRQHVDGVSQFWKKTHEFWKPDGAGLVRVPGGTSSRRQSIIIPPLDELRNKFSDLQGHEFDGKG